MFFHRIIITCELIMLCDGILVTRKELEIYIWVGC